MDKLTEIMTVRVSAEQYAVIKSRAEAEGQSPSEWLRLKALESNASVMSREVLEIRIGVNAIADLLMKAFPDKLPIEFVRKIVKQGRDYVANQKAGSNGDSAGDRKADRTYE